MLELRPVCEHCGCALPPESNDAMICSYECTFCRDCVVSVLQNVCPNCGGGFEQRPVRPREELCRNPAGTAHNHRPVDPAHMAKMIAIFGTIDPARR